MFIYPCNLWVQSGSWRQCNFFHCSTRVSYWALFTNSTTKLCTRVTHITMQTVSNSAHCLSSCFHCIIARHGGKVHTSSSLLVTIMSDPSFPVFPILALVGAVLVLIPFPWHLQAWNSGTCLYMLWTSLGLINLAVNSIVWRSSVVNYAPVWCDICKFPLFIWRLDLRQYGSITLHCRGSCSNPCRLPLYQSPPL